MQGSCILSTFIGGHSMYQYIIRRFLVFIPMLFALSIIVFGLAKAAPGDPFTGKILDPKINPEVYEATA